MLNTSKYDLILALRSQIFESLRETFYRYALEYSTCNWLVQKKRGGKRNCFSDGNAWSLSTSFEGLWSVGTRFRHYCSASPRPSTKKKLATSPPSTVHGGQCMILNMWHSSSYCMRHSWRTPCGVISFNQLVCSLVCAPRPESTLSYILRSTRLRLNFYSSQKEQTNAFD